MRALIDKLDRLAGASDVYTRIGWACLAGCVVLVALLATGAMH